MADQAHRPGHTDCRPLPRGSIRLNSCPMNDSSDRTWRLLHLTASTFFGGPERQMLGLARALHDEARTTFASFSEGERSDEFLSRARQSGFDAVRLQYDSPHWLSAIREIADLIRVCRADVLLTHGYKADLLGYRAARRVGTPAVAVSRGWTGESWKVRLYEWLDRRALRHFDQVVAVSDGQARKVLKSGVAPANVRVIRNAARLHAFAPPSPAGRRQLWKLAPSPGELLIVTAARLSPEKGIGVLIAAAADVVAEHPLARFLIFGEGPLRPELQSCIHRNKLHHAVTLAGYRDDLDELLPNADVAVLPSYTEGLPNAVLEACAAGVPVVATAVGGTPEVLADGDGGFLVPPGDAAALADRINALLRDGALRRTMGAAGRARVEAEFTFDAQARQYRDLFAELVAEPVAA